MCYWKAFLLSPETTWVLYFVVFFHNLGFDGCYSIVNWLIFLLHLLLLPSCIRLICGFIWLHQEQICHRSLLLADTVKESWKLFSLLLLLLPSSSSSSFFISILLFEEHAAGHVYHLASWIEMKRREKQPVKERKREKGNNNKMNKQVHLCWWWRLWGLFLPLINRLIVSCCFSSSFPLYPLQDTVYSIACCPLKRRWNWEKQTGDNRVM